MINLSLFASGTGSNVKSIIDYFQYNNSIKVGSIVTNKADAGVIKYASSDIKLIMAPNTKAIREELPAKLKAIGVDYIILAGFLKMIPIELLDVFNNRIINIHPSLLPKYGGKGMYGANVHQAVFENKETKSGMTIHLVNEEYDKGRILFQDSCDITHCQSPQDIAKCVLKLEHYNYPRVIEKFVSSN